MSGFDVVDCASYRAIASSPDITVAMAVATELSHRREGVDLVGSGWAAWFFWGEVLVVLGPVPPEIRQLWVSRSQGVA